MTTISFVRDERFPMELVERVDVLFDLSRRDRDLYFVRQVVGSIITSNTTEVWGDELGPITIEDGDTSFD